MRHMCVKFDFCIYISCEGFVIRKKKLGKRKACDKFEEDSGSWETNAKFQNVTFWNHESLPSQDDAFLRSFHWLAVAKAEDRKIPIILGRPFLATDQTLIGIVVDGLSVNETNFKGRKLEGTTMPLPQGYSVPRWCTRFEISFSELSAYDTPPTPSPPKDLRFVIRKKLSMRKASDKSEEDSGSWETNAKFQNITLWNHDSLPSQDNAFLRSFHWLAVAKAADYDLRFTSQEMRLQQIESEVTAEKSSPVYRCHRGVLRNAQQELTVFCNNLSAKQDMASKQSLVGPLINARDLTITSGSELCYWKWSHLKEAICGDVNEVAELYLRFSAYKLMENMGK
ncbi:hypothetical protein AgCh_024101 [Apium graveolens]